MEHLIQFGVSIDDNAIIEAVKRNAERAIIDMLKREVENAIFSSRYTYGHTRDAHSTFSKLTQDVLNDFLNANKEVILDRASVILADKLARSKAGKAILEDIQ